MCTSKVTHFGKMQGACCILPHSEKTPYLGSFSKFWFQIYCNFPSTVLRPVAETVGKQMRHSDGTPYYDIGKAAAALSFPRWDAEVLTPNCGQFHTETLAQN